ncbi:MAG: ABC transporter ATP-binding protein [Thermodesulfovibrio sp.]|nr:ABC transporter ATP-binding protein [Thermodesulfovibrio sp.]
MNDIVIQTERLSKKYRIGKKYDKYRTLRDTIADSSRALFERAGRLMNGQATVAPPGDESIWALRDVSFDVSRGEIVGIIGRNGAGKSTLLKILSRVTEPEDGRGWICGRVGSLLEVGSGFHPELTGRENVYLNGAIIGMKKSEINRKFDEIVSFAEVEQFIDTPVKHYSSGMYLRLAFSVAAHLEPDIMLVDEVLAVGDARFWNKSIHKMRTLNAQGMTILLVTHDMWLVQTICSRAICLEKGSVVTDGTPLNAIGLYKQLTGQLTGQLANTATGDASGKKESSADGGFAELHEFEMFPAGEGVSKNGSLPDSGIRVEMKAHVDGVLSVGFLLRVTSPDGFPYFTVYSEPVSPGDGGLVECRAHIPHLMLLPGDYVLWGAVCRGGDEEQILTERHLPLLVNGNGTTSNGKSLFWNRAEWQVHATC